LTLKLRSSNGKLRVENRLLSTALGRSLALLNELLQVEDWEEFTEKRDAIEASMRTVLDDMEANGEGDGP
jgi:hypothetical protein